MVSLCKLGLPEPVETYSSSEHLNEIMKIHAGSTGRMDKPRNAAPVREKSEKSEKSETTAAPRQKRERVRTKKFSS